MKKTLLFLFRPCNADQNYSFSDCLDLAYLVRSGRECQDPWYINPSIGLDVCSSKERIVENNQDLPQFVKDRPYESARKISQKMNCPLPCTMTFYTLEYT